MKPSPGVSAGLLAGRARSWSLDARPMVPELLSDRWGEGGGAVPDTVGYGVWDVPELMLAC